MASVARKADAMSGREALRRRVVTYWRLKRRTIVGTASLVCFFGLWQILFELGFVDPLLIGSPGGVFESIWVNTTNGTLLPHFRVSAIEFSIGFSTGAAVGILAGVVIGYFKLLDEIFEPLVALLYAAPYVAFLPAIIVAFGIGTAPKAFIVFLSTVFPLLINTITGVKNTPREYLRVAHSFCAGRLELLAAVVLPSAVPYVLAGMRQSIARGLVGVIVGEFFLSNQGVGYYIQAASAAYRPNDSFAVILIVSLVGLVMVRTVAAVERRIARRWGLSAGA